MYVLCSPLFTRLWLCWFFHALQSFEEKYTYTAVSYTLYTQTWISSPSIAFNFLLLVFTQASSYILAFCFMSARCEWILLIKLIKRRQIDIMRNRFFFMIGARVWQEDINATLALIYIDCLKLILFKYLKNFNAVLSFLLFNVNKCRYSHNIIKRLDAVVICQKRPYLTTFKYFALCFSYSVCVNKNFNELYKFQYTTRRNDDDDTKL